MKMTSSEMEKKLFGFVDEIKDILSPELWGNLLLDCSKNEVLILGLLYRQSEVNMSQIAEYIHTPLNTATGIIARMEKKNLVVRERSVEDRRIVTVKIGEQGKVQMQSMLKEISYYGFQVLDEFSQEEIALFVQMMGKFMNIIKKERRKSTDKSKVRKIVIE